MDCGGLCNEIIPYKRGRNDRTSRIIERIVVMSDGFSMSCVLLFNSVMAASLVAQFSIN